MLVTRPVRLILSAMLLVGAASLQAQIINIEKKRISTDAPGWFGSANLSFSGAKTTKSIVSIFAGTHLEYKSFDCDDVWLFITDFSLISGDKEKFSNAGYGHIRYNHKLGKVVRLEVFTQIQYNALTKINTRALGGTGLRFKLTQYEQAKFYWGVAYMFEYEELLDPIIYNRNHRMSSYFTFTLLPVETVTFMSTFYVQPLLTDFGDYQMANETTLSLAISKKLVLNTTFKYNYDSVPPEGVPASTYYFINGLELSF